MRGDPSTGALVGVEARSDTTTARPRWIILALAGLAVLGFLDELLSAPEPLDVASWVTLLALLGSWPLVTWRPVAGILLALVACLAASTTVDGLGIPTLTAVIVIVAATILLPGRWAYLAAPPFLAWAGWTAHVLEGGRTLLWGLVLVLLIAAAVGVFVRLVGLSLVSTRRSIGRLRREQAEIRSQERLAIARDLHDVVAYELTLISLTCANQRRVTDPEALRAAIDTVAGMSRSALMELRSLLGVLRDDADVEPQIPGHHDLPAAVDTLVQSTRATGLDVRTDLRLDGWEDLRPTVRTSLLRVLQESLANVGKYAPPGATCQVEVVVADAVTLSVTSPLPATGPRRRDAAHGAGHGIIGMRERVEALGGTLEVGPQGRHWVVRAVLPG